MLPEGISILLIWLLLRISFCNLKKIKKNQRTSKSLQDQILEKINSVVNTHKNIYQFTYTHWWFIAQSFKKNKIINQGLTSMKQHTYIWTVITYPDIKSHYLPHVYTYVHPNIYIHICNILHEGYRVSNLIYHLSNHMKNTVWKIYFTYLLSFESCNTKFHSVIIFPCKFSTSIFSKAASYLKHFEV